MKIIKNNFPKLIYVSWLPFVKELYFEETCENEYIRIKTTHR